jgi:hypothetical protein
MLNTHKFNKNLIIHLISRLRDGFTMDSRFDPFVGPPWIETACGVWQGGLNPKRSIESPEPNPPH